MVRSAFALVAALALVAAARAEEPAALLVDGDLSAPRRFTPPIQF
jgi:hypothetical protein